MHYRAARLCFEFHVAVDEVAHPAGDAESTRGGHCEVAVSDALHPSGYRGMNSDGLLIFMSVLFLPRNLPNAIIVR